MTTYNEFSIQDVIPDLSQKRVIIKTNFKIDPDTVLPTNVAFYNYDLTALEAYQLVVDGKNIHIVLNEYPTDGTRYYLKIKGLKDALGRQLKTEFDDYIIFESDLRTKVQILNPKSRETLKSRVVTVKLKLTEIEDNCKCKIEISSDNIFYNILTIVEQDITGEEISIDTNVERDGQIYIRARAEKNSSVVGDWSETICFNIYTIPMDSIETNFLEEYLTTNDLFDDSIELIETVIEGKSPTATNEGAFYIDFNKEILLPANYELDENGYVNLGVVIGFRKELK